MQEGLIQLSQEGRSRLDLVSAPIFHKDRVLICKSIDSSQNYYVHAEVYLLPEKEVTQKIQVPHAFVELIIPDYEEKNFGFVIDPNNKD
jgi:hypothetical protein